MAKQVFVSNPLSMDVTEEEFAAILASESEPKVLVLTWPPEDDECRHSVGYCENCVPHHEL